MPRAQFRDSVLLQSPSGNLSTAPIGSLVTLVDVNTSTGIQEPIYADESSDSLLTNPLTLGPGGSVDFWLTEERELDLVINFPGWDPMRVTVTTDSATGPTTSDPLLFAPDGTQDIGEPTDNRPRAVYVAGWLGLAEQGVPPVAPPAGQVLVYTKADGHVYMLDSTGAESMLDQPGPVGPAGPQGIQGAAGPTGPQGVVGPQGAAGPAGAVGPTGPPGTPGTNGAAGPIGPQGVAGPVGAAGPAGAVGQTGPQGPQGVPGTNGLNGAKGDTGDQGPAGPVGPPGVTGSAGPAGPAGPKGDMGPTGSPGAVGATGPAGPKGDTGLTGATGSQGPTGLTGPPGQNGQQGPAGPQGTPGATGPAGPKGDTGATGQDGAPGAPGTNGKDGSTGPAGPAGPSGTPGAVGPAGPKGDTGSPGKDGVNGPQGIPGPQGATGAAGKDGKDGAPGATGATGAAGPPGTNGQQGPAGPQGLPGPTGATGPKGDVGATGATGPVGPPGTNGVQGPVGPQGAQGPIGPPGVVWEGTWVATTTYEPNDGVYYAGSSYRAVAQSMGVTPGTNGAVWVLMAQKGDIGPVGPAGPGVAPGGAVAQVLAKVDATDYNTQWVSPFTQALADALYLPLTGGELDGPLTVGGALTASAGAAVTGDLAVSGGISAGSAFLGSGAVPVGGDAGQVLGKASVTDYDLLWITPLTLPFGQDLLFSTDNTYNIGAGSDNRPQNIFAASNVRANSLISDGVSYAYGGQMVQTWLRFTNDNAYDIGAVGVNRPRNIYAATSVFIGNDPYSQIGGTTGGINMFGSLLWNTDNAHDIGAAGASRPQNVYVANTVYTGGLQATQGQILAIDGSTTVPGYGFYSESGTGFTRGAHQSISAVGTGGHILAVFGPAFGNDPVDYPYIFATASGSVGMYAAGADTNVSVSLSSKGSGQVSFLSNTVGNYLLQLLPVASSVNYWQMQAAAAGGAPAVFVQGSDANISLGINPKGNGIIALNAAVSVSNGITVNSGNVQLGNGSLTASNNVSAYGGLQAGNNSVLGGSMWSGSGAPAAGLGANGDQYHRTDTPAVAGQRIYIKSAGAWLSLDGVPTFPVLAPNGSAGAPSYSFASNAAWGLYYASSTAGLAVPNNLNIGTVQPGSTYRLFVSGATSDGSSYPLVCANSGGSSVGWIRSDGAMYVANTGQFVGAVGIGAAPATYYGLQIGIALAGATTQYGLYIDPTIGNTTTVAGAVATMLFKTAAGTFTMPSGYGLNLLAPSLGSGTTVTSLYGLYVANQGVSGVTNAYGLYIANQSGAATTNVGLYNAGTSTFVGDATFQGHVITQHVWAPSGQNIGLGTATDQDLWYIQVGTGHLLADYDNSSDIGSQYGNRPRDMWLGRNLNVVGTLTAAATTLGSLNVGGNINATGGPSGFAFGLTLNSGVFLAPNGTSGAPSYSFSGSPTYGLFMVTATIMALSAGNASVILMQSTQVAIGTTLSTQGIIFTTDNSYDIGAAGANRPRNVYVAGAISGNGSVPTGGAANQVLTKNSATNYDVAWVTPSGGALSWPLLAPNGTAGAPSYSFTNANTTGIYSTGAGNLSLSLSAVQQVILSTSGVQFASSVNVGIGVAPVAYAGLYFQPTLAGANQFAFYAPLTFSTTGTGNNYVVYLLATFANSSRTVTSGANIYADTPSIGSSVTVTSMYGLYVANQGSGRNINAYGVYIAAQSGAATTNMGLYNGGSEQTMGTVGLGSAPLASTGISMQPGNSYITGTTQYGIQLVPYVTSGATGYYGIFAAVRPGSNFTVTNAYIFCATYPSSQSAGSVITNMYGFYVGNIAANNGVTNAYGVYISSISGASTTNIGLYNASSMQVQGAVGFGTAPVSGQVTFATNVRQTSGDATFLRLGAGAGTDPAYDLRVNGSMYVGGNINFSGNFSTNGQINAGGQLSGQYIVTGGNLSVDQGITMLSTSQIKWNNDSNHSINVDTGNNVAHWDEYGSWQFRSSSHSLANAMSLDANGNMSINGTLQLAGSNNLVYFNAANTCYIQGLGNAMRYATPAAGNVHSFEGPGGVQLAPLNASAFNVASSRRFKDSLVPLESPLSKVLDTRATPYSYVLTAESKPDIGFTAEDMVSVVPEAVWHNDAGEPYAINYSALVPVLWGAVRELSARLQALEGAT